MPILVLLVGGRVPWYPAHARPTKGKIVRPSTKISSKAICSIRTCTPTLTWRATLQPLCKPSRKRRARPNWTPTRSTSDGRSGKRTQRLRRRPKSRAGKSKERQQQSYRSAGLDRYTGRNITERHDCRRRDHYARTGAAPALPFTTPHSFFRGFGGLGQGLGIALGMKLAAPERPVTLLIGDGGFLSIR